MTARIVNINKNAPAFFGIKGGIDANSATIISPVASFASKQSFCSSKDICTPSPVGSCSRNIVGSTSKPVKKNKLASPKSQTLSSLHKASLAAGEENSKLKLITIENVIKSNQIEVLELEKAKIQLQCTKLNAEVELYKTMNEYYTQKLKYV